MRTLFLLLLGLMLGACGNGEPETSTAVVPAEAIEINTQASASYDEALAAATVAIKAAADKGHAWNTADKLLLDAAAAAAAGDESLALRLADEARIQALLAAAQAETESTAWQSRVITD